MNHKRGKSQIFFSIIKFHLRSNEGSRSFEIRLIFLSAAGMAGNATYMNSQYVEMKNM